MQQKVINDLNIAKNILCHPQMFSPEMCIRIGQAITSAIALLKEQETKHGEWLESKILEDCFWVCSECEFPSEAFAAPMLYKYCPNCEVKMDRR